MNDLRVGRRLGAGILSIAFVVAACGRAAAPAASPTLLPPDAPVTASPDGGGVAPVDPGAGGAKPVVPKPGQLDVRELHPDLLWGHIGLVPQKPYLFSGTVRSNLLYGKPDATEDELWRALAIAQAEDFVREMEGGLDAPVSQGGTNVSGGQRQRIAIARALVKRPELYIFDDSFSSLDTATDARLRQALKQHTAGATLVIIAQRVSSIVDADQILVLDGGRIVAHGTHQELLETSETYREIVNSQLAAEEAA